MSDYSKENPYWAHLCERSLLNKPGSSKETRHFVVDLGDSGLSYAAGDSLGVMPTNRPEDVEALLEVLGFSGEELVKAPRGTEDESIRTVLARSCALAQPTKKFLQTLADKVAGYPPSSERLSQLLDRANAELLKEYLAQSEYVDLLEDYPMARFEPQEFVDELRRLTPRLYSIASSPLQFPREIHLTVAVVRYTARGRSRVGVASTFLADRIAVGQSRFPVFVQSSHFRLPEDGSRDVIMVGPGTGIAPFRAFLQERIASGATGRNWLFFGDQHQATDYLYGEELEACRAAGALSRLDLAFSRDQVQKVYVQDRMRESASALWDWLQNGACFYVCGDASRMAKDVEQALIDIAQSEGGLDAEGAADYVRQLRKDKRYQKDVY